MPHDDLVKALGSDTGISKSEVSRICADLDEQLGAFRTRPLDHIRFPYLFLDATYVKARVDHRIVSQAIVIATSVTQNGGREVVGVMVGDSETEVFWAQFLRHLRERGPSGVRLVISDSHSGLVKAIRKVMLGWQRCRVHFVRNVFAVIPKGSAEMVAATIRTVFAQPTADAVRAQLDTVADMLGRRSAARCRDGSSSGPCGSRSPRTSRISSTDRRTRDRRDRALPRPSQRGSPCLSSVPLPPRRSRR